MPMLEPFSAKLWKHLMMVSTLGVGKCCVRDGKRLFGRLDIPMRQANRSFDETLEQCSLEDNSVQEQRNKLPTVIEEAAKESMGSWKGLTKSVETWPRRDTPG